MAEDHETYSARRCGHLRGPVGLGLLILLLPYAQAVDNWEMDGANGTLYVHGALTQSACRLEMASAHQAIALGEIATGRLPRVGDRGEPTRFELRLVDCLPGPGGSRDSRSGALTWADSQPAVTVRFQASRDADNPQLVKAQGVLGMGLRMADGQGQDVRLGSRGGPLLLVPGQNTLSYTVAPERTRALLQAGAYSAVVDFGLSYD